MLIVSNDVQAHISSDSRTYQDYPALAHLTHVFFATYIQMRDIIYEILYD